MSSSTSFNRSNVYYQSLPINNTTSSSSSSSKLVSSPQPPTSTTTTKSVNFKSTTTTTTTPSSLANDMSSSASSDSAKFHSSINTEEFAKLDALLEDLLAEVDQPILLNHHKEIPTAINPDLKQQQQQRSTQSSSPYFVSSPPPLPTDHHNHHHGHHHHHHHHQVERSVDWLNEQKEILRARKEAAAAQQPYRKIKSKLDYYITSSSGDGVNGNASDLNGGNETGAQIPIINNKPPVSPSARQLYSPNTTTTMTNVTQIPIHQQQSLVISNGNNNTTTNNSFRSLSNNAAALLKNINETDDENLIDSEFDRYSQKSYKSQASTIQRSKYHVISNDYIESTRPTAATPVPTYNPPTTVNRSFYQSKRALSAPPTEVGKVMLQRMELKSPLTVRQTSVVPFEAQQQNGEQIFLGAPADDPNLMQAQAVPIQQRSYIDNPYNNRGVLRSSNNNNFTSQQQQMLALPQSSSGVQQQVVPATRNVYLNRSYSEVPRGAGVYTNGYETDSGLVTHHQYHHQPSAYGTYRPVQTPQPQIVYTRVEQTTLPPPPPPSSVTNGNFVETANEFDGLQQQQRQAYRVVNANSPSAMMVGSYRTLGAPVSSSNGQQRYQLINDQSGYDTDTGLIKLRHVLDSTRRASSRNSNNNVPTVYPHQYNNGNAPGYVYQQQQQMSNGRYTPQFNTSHVYTTNGQPQMRLVGPQYNSQPSIHQQQHPVVNGNGSFVESPLTTTTTTTTTTSNNNGGVAGGYPLDEFPNLIQPINDFQYIDANGNIVKGVPAFVSPDGRQIILKDIDPISGIGEAIVTPPPQPHHQQQQQQPTSFIVQHHMAPSSAVSVSANSTLARNSSSNNNNHQASMNGNGFAQAGARVTSSSSNLTSHQQQQQQPVIINNKHASSSMEATNGSQDTRRVSNATNSLAADPNEVIRAHPKFVKTTQTYWYKPKISRDEAIMLLRDKPPGTFLIRDSNNFPGAYGLALKVDKPPANVQIKAGADPLNELVRHFLIEPTPKGVRIKGCVNEPVFGSLAALVYQHSLTQLALPIKLILPSQDLTVTTPGSTSNGHISTSASHTSNLNGHHHPHTIDETIITTNNSNTAPNSRQNTLTKQHSNVQQQQQQQQQNNMSSSSDGRQLLEKGAACNVYYLNTVNIESRNGLEGITHALNNTKAFTNKDSTQLLLIQFKVTAQGITITDLNKKKFIRQHFPTSTVIYCAVDEKYTWPNRLEKISKPRIFGLVCKPQVNKGSNECHLFVELDPEQPAIAIVDFINRYLIPSKLLSKN